MKDLRRSALVFLLTLVVGVFALAAVLIPRAIFPDSNHLMLAGMLTALVTVAYSFPLHSAPTLKFSVHTPIAFATVLLFEPGTAMLIVGVGTLAAQVLCRQPFDQTLFNTAQMMLQAAISGLILLLGGWSFTTFQFDSLFQIGVICIAAAAMYLVEVTTVAIIAGLQSGQSPVRVWRQIASFDGIELTAQFALGVLAAIIFAGHPWALPLLLAPIAVIYRSSARHSTLQQQARALAYEASHDPLTGLSNRSLFSDRLQHALVRGDRRNTSAAVLFLDLDRFKVINDSLGHEVGDQLLVGVAKRLQQCLRPEDTVARFGGDEFTILVEDVAHVSDVTRVADRITEVLSVPFDLSGHEVTITTSMGIALSTPGLEQPEELLRDADVAMYRAKDRGKAHYELFDAQMNERALDRLKRETELRQAGERQQFRVFYQPIVSLATNRITSFEALVRWEHPEHGLMSPGDFIPVAEDAGLIIHIDQWVLETACAQTRLWQEKYPLDPPIGISINLSVRNFHYGRLVDDVRQILQKTGLDPHTLHLEITESVMLEDEQGAQTTLQALRNLGVEVAIDDFGMGYSSLRYLQHFPVETLKIDKTFIRMLGQDVSSKGIVDTVNRLADTLCMKVVAEGVETDEQYLMLRAMGCEAGQGYFFSKALPPEAVDVLLAEGVHLEAVRAVNSVVSSQ